MSKKKNIEENIVEEEVFDTKKKNVDENVDDENFDDEDFGDVVVEMTDDEGNSYLYTEQMIIPVGDDDFALLVEIKDHDHCDHEHNHENGECGCGCDCEDGDVIIAKIITDEETGEDIYVEPTDAEFEAVQKAYETMIEADFDDEE